MALQDQETGMVHNDDVLDALFCQEQESFCDDDDDAVDNVRKEAFLFEHDLYWEDEELKNLFLKEKKCNSELICDDGLLRKEGVEWILRGNGYHGFTALTGVLAVNYFDRFCASFRLLKDKPWMSQLVAVACLSLAAKVEETQVPLLLDLQVGECRYVFEAKTIQRMELLVLSTLQWRMNPVTPISFFDHIVRRLGLRTNLQWEFMWMCERRLISILSDSGLLCYRPSILAAATMLHVIEEVEPCTPEMYEDQLMDVLRINKDEVYECYKLIQDVSGTGKDGFTRHQSQKRKNLCPPGSPDGVMYASFNSDSSNDSWTATSLISSTPEPLFKRRKVQDQPMRLPSMNRVSVDVLSSPH